MLQIEVAGVENPDMDGSGERVEVCDDTSVSPKSEPMLTRKMLEYVRKASNGSTVMVFDCFAPHGSTNGLTGHDTFWRYSADQHVSVKAGWFVNSLMIRDTN